MYNTRPSGGSADWVIDVLEQIGRRAEVLDLGRRPGAGLCGPTVYRGLPDVISFRHTAATSQCHSTLLYCVPDARLLNKSSYLVQAYLLSGLMTANHSRAVLSHSGTGYTATSAGYTSTQNTVPADCSHCSISHSSVNNLPSLPCPPISGA
ncbi:hypothetical protein J6590_081764 [Homalodisca vitripennis]|nr:hypothetical protein J6590_081764 [Homalodisca vitripennis]